MPLLALNGICKCYGAHVVLDDVSLIDEHAASAAMKTMGAIRR